MFLQQQLVVLVPLPVLVPVLVLLVSQTDRRWNQVTVLQQQQKLLHVWFWLSLGQTEQNQDEQTGSGMEEFLRVLLRVLDPQFHQISDGFLSLSSVSQHASGLQVFEGAEFVQLPCWVKVSESNGSTAVWDQDELRIPTVHVRQPDGDYLKDQNRRYAGRTAMMEDALLTGDLSLTLRRPSFTDSGTFTCTVRRLGVELHQEAVELQVKGQGCRSKNLDLKIWTRLSPGWLLVHRIDVDVEQVEWLRKQPLLVQRKETL
ncbi:hypothetical protein CCH79_00019734 [Gambusia affinis]|uniref:Ig-like domain-containing protein n=1 Tax=Gambusia affinis TaxID=33528 RepID=A0A315V8C9_GAMAF|nr:hypothetical protein CCH79_00019734 [Gambusia affinis]